MRRAVVLVLASLLLLGACRRADEPRAASPSPAGSPGQLPGASCEDQEGGNSQIFPDFVSVDLKSQGGIDRVTFRFRQTDPAASDPPLYFVRYVDQLVTDGEGAPVEVEGKSFVSVSFMAVGFDLSGETPIEVYTGPDEFTPRFPTVRQLKKTGDFEGVVSWGIGLAREACVVVEATDSELVLEFPSP
jgi:major membrane immunogen (membrane-anchored lipoprotein)